MEKKLKEQIIDLLKEIVESLKQPKNEKIQKITFTIQEAALYIGTSREKITELVYKTNTDFPYFKVGAKTLIDKKLLDKWIEKITYEHREL
ncbi:helix-turn-helix domain-containing protein [Clostridium sp. C2-6-12]|uniref:helix-turn-helix domain-containing protein n=1 Tax=Clostridium sp. C2-6-12 TaxID=2698832 RepID=UPI0019234E63|nr:helix-turn-helix domain-containing protein [Clostridium sp. C2-6-12]